MFGIKEEEPQKDENINKSEENKIENNEIKIVEMTINLSNKDRIIQRSNKKQNKSFNGEPKNDKEKEKEGPILNLISASKKIENTQIKDKNDKKEDKNESKNNLFNNSNNKSNNLFEIKPIENPFTTLIGNKNSKLKKDDENKNNEKSTFNLFVNISNNNKIEGDKTETKQPLLFGKTNTNLTYNNDSKTNNNNSGNSLFSNNFSLFSGNNGKPLFSNNDSNNDNNNGNTKSLFSSNNGVSLFSDNYKNKPLFSGSTNNSTLFTNFNNNDKSGIFTPNLFSNNNNINTNPFSKIKGESFIQSLINNNKENNKNTNNGESLFDDNKTNNGDEEEDERDKPKTKYVSEPLKAQDYSEYSKLYNTHLFNLFLFNKQDKKYISKGNGFFSIEKTKDEQNKKHQAVVVFRNQTGNKIVEGFIDKKLDKFEIYNKDFNYVVCFGIIMINDGTPQLGYIKIPFKTEENANALREAYKNAINFIEEK